MKTFHAPFLISTLFIVGWILPGCSARLSPYQVAGKFGIMAPGYLKPTTGLHENAPLQLENRILEVYVLGRFDQKSTVLAKDNSINLEDYYSITVDNLVYALTKEEYSDPEETVIDGMPSLKGTITGLLNEVPVTYYLTVIESNQNFYQVLAWSRSEDSVEYSSDLKALIASFHLLAAGNATPLSTNQ